MLEVIRRGLTAHRNPQLVDELLEAYGDAKKNFHRGGLRLSAVEGGRFCEAAFRMLEEHAFGAFVPIGTSLDTEKLATRLLNASPRPPDSIRIHIPRALRVVYDIRNKRDAAHLGDGIDPNAQDATLVISVLDWVLAEFVRLYHNVGATEAQRIVVGLVRRQAPIVEETGKELRILNPKLGVTDSVLVLLYHRGAEGVAKGELEKWLRPSMRANLARTLRQLCDKKALAIRVEGRYRISQLGMQDVERRGLLEPE